MINSFKKLYDDVDDKLLQMSVKGTVAMAGVGLGVDALAQTGQNNSNTGQKSLIKDTTGYNPDDTNITANGAQDNATALGKTIMNIVMTFATVIGLLMLFFGVMSLRKINQQGGGQDEKKKSMFYIITGVLLSTLGLLYAVFFALVETSLTK